jgi:hypothetical protein
VVRKSSGPKGRAGSTPALGIPLLMKRGEILCFSSFLITVFLPAYMLFKSSRLFLVVLLAIGIAILGFVFIRNLIDFPVYYAAGQSLLQGRTNLYASDFALGRVMDYRYPPFFLLVFIPLWLLPYKVAAYLWYLFSIFQIAACIVFLKNLIKPIVVSKKIWLLLFCGVGQYFIIILHYGNAHLLTIFLLFGSLYFALKRKDTKAALLMALAITIKLTPAFMLVYFLLKKRWRYLGLTAAFLFAINLFPAVYFGFTQNAQLLKGWYHHVVVNQEFHETNGPINLSLKGQLRRYFTEVDYQQRIDGDTRYPAVNLASFSPQYMATVWLVLSMIFVAFAACLVYRNCEYELHNSDKSDVNVRVTDEKIDGFNEKALVELGLLLSLMLLIEPLTSKIYFIALLWPLMVLAVTVFEKSTTENHRIRPVLLFIAILNFVLPLLPGRSIQRGLLALGADFYVNLLLLGAQIYYLLVLRKRHQLPTAEPQTQAL